MHNFFLHLNLICILWVIILSKRSSGADYRYEACVPFLCGGVNISFPFYIQGLQEPYCGSPDPGFVLNCSNLRFPVLGLPGNEYVIQGISYESQTFRVFDSAVLSSNPSSNCLPGIRNSTLSTYPQFAYVDVTHLRLFENCSKTSATSDLSRYKADCNNWDLALYDDNRYENFTRIALETCAKNVLLPVDGASESGGGNGGIGEVLEVVRNGFELKWTAADCDTCETSGGHCGFNETSYKFMCFCPDRPHSGSCKPGKDKKKVIVAAVSAISGAAFLACLLVCFIIRRNKKRVKDAYRHPRNISSDPSSNSDIEGGSLYMGIPVFSYTELVEATNNFDSSQELGDGGFGTVYYGKLRDGREVAVKRLYEHNYRRVEQFMNEIKILTCLKHPNLVTLYGCTSRRSRELLLVYEYIENGTVADHLHGEKAEESPIAWPIRLNIAIETATALTYLHKSDIIHRDVKTNNILLTGNFCVKVADFGLSRLFPIAATHISTAPQGTPGYVDPEYHQCYQLTGKSDVYSFGVVLVELISSMPAVDINRHRHEINLANFALNKIQKCAFDELIDSSLGYGTDAEVTRMTTSMAELAFRCLQPEKEMRPSMDEVLAYLKDIQSGDEENRNGKMLHSPETDEVMLLKNKNLLSPVAVTDKWISSSSTIESSIE